MNERWVGVENEFFSKIISKLGHNLVFLYLTPNFERRKHFRSLEKIKRRKKKSKHVFGASERLFYPGTRAPLN